jgi:hypothetical protein
VPPPRFNLVRYHGLLAPAAHWRPLVIPSTPRTEASEHQFHRGCKAESSGRKIPRGEYSKKQHHSRRPRNYSWAELMRRVFSIDVLECCRCGGRMRIIAAIRPRRSAEFSIVSDCHLGHHRNGIKGMRGTWSFYKRPGDRAPNRTLLQISRHWHVL